MLPAIIAFAVYPPHERHNDPLARICHQIYFCFMLLCTRLAQRECRSPSPRVNQ
ncbi:hypothetical protein EM595_0242 [Duffyella gerundensis]|uniref:Uncharacterized protein n=1 Tax=Duffyella gerundensis TaxID=1619313 RepID=A0A0U5KYE9_9GAMM|nr:hypothetical protein EM595_0242 [Duffyella gerundensis]